MENEETEVQFRTSTLKFNESYSNSVLLSFPEVSINKNYKGRDNISGNDINSIPKSNENAYNELIEPELDLKKLKDFYDISDALRTAIDVFVTNVVGFGYDFKPEWDIVEKNGIAVFVETNEPVPPQILKEMKEEKARITMFYLSLSLDNTWTQEQKNKLTLKEIYGNSYVEYERDLEGNLQGAVLIDSDTIRLTKHEDTGILIENFIKNPDTLEFETQLRLKKFRRYVQLSSGGAIKTYFKEFGDPRIMNAYTGKYYKNSIGEYITDVNFIPENEKFKAATEIYHFKVLDPGNLYGYGIPRWVSLIPQLLGVRSSDLLNAETFKNKGIPDFIVIVEGATADTIVNQIEDHVKQNKKMDKFGNLLVVSADSKKIGAAGPNMDYKNPAIRIEPLNILTQKEGMALDYQKEARERIAGIYRIPSFLLGKSSEVNRATAEILKQVFEEQVCRPARVEEDDIQNNKILTDFKAKYYRYYSKSSKIENLELKSTILLDGLQKGAFIPREIHKILNKDLDLGLEDLNEDFMNKPLTISLAEKRSGILPENKNLVLPLEDQPKAEIYQKLKKVLENEGLTGIRMYLVGNKNDN